MVAITTITTSDAFAATISSLPPTTLLVLSFHTAWAPPCQQMDEILAAIASTYPDHTPSPISFLRIDAEELSDISESFDVTAVPFMVLQRGGKRLESVSGCDVDKIKGAIKRWESEKAGSGAKVKLPDELKVTPRADADTIVPAPAAAAVASGGHMNGATNGADHESAAVDTLAKASGAQIAATTKSAQETDDELRKRISELVTAAKVMLFMKGTPSSPQCGFSRQLVAILRENKVRYGFFNILADEDIRQGLKVFADWPTFPQLWMDGELVGGLDIVKEEVETNPGFFKEYTAEASKAAEANEAAASS